jgi:hypothetical protein
MANSKTYYFLNDYTTKHGVVKKGESLSAYPSGKKFVFDFYEKTDPAKAEAGEGIFSITEADMKNIVSETAPTKSADAKTTTTTTTETTKKAEENKTAKTGFSSWSTTKKTLVVGGGLVVVGLAVWYFVIRKK